MVEGTLFDGVIPGLRTMIKLIITSNAERTPREHRAGSELID